jgi:DNA-binding CsgD family transcriptional regulator
MLVLDDRGAIEYATGEADRWLAQLPREAGELLPAPVLAVAMQARAESLAGGPVYDAPAQSRVRLPSGSWLYVHAAVLHGAPGAALRIAVMLEPADRAQLLPLLAHVHGLTEREREVTELLVGGLATDEIAARMSISRHTLRDHVKAVFAKVGVASRPELTARFLPELAPQHSGR